jgi:hypothetical protein
MSDAVMGVPDQHGGRSAGLDRVLADLLRAVPELEAAAVVSFDGLAMASALPAGMDEDRVAAMSAALLSLGEKAAAGLGRGDLSQVYVEGDHGTVFLVSAEDEAVPWCGRRCGQDRPGALRDPPCRAAGRRAGRASSPRWPRSRPVDVDVVTAFPPLASVDEAPAPVEAFSAPPGQAEPVLSAVVTPLPTAPPLGWAAPAEAAEAELEPAPPPAFDPLAAPPAWATPPAPPRPADAWTG